MRKISGYVFCKLTSRVLHNPIVYWFEKDGHIQEKVMGTQSEGKFEVDIPEALDKLYVANRGYSVREIKLSPHTQKVLVYLSKD